MTICTLNDDSGTESSWASMLYEGLTKVLEIIHTVAKNLKGKYLFLFGMFIVLVVAIIAVPYFLHGYLTSSEIMMIIGLLIILMLFAYAVVCIDIYARSQSNK